MKLDQTLSKTQSGRPNVTTPSEDPGEALILQQDNEPNHTSKICKSYLKTTVT